MHLERGGSRQSLEPETLMRVLWFTNDPLPVVLRHMGRTPTGTGAWMPSLLENLMATPGLEIDVVSAYPGLRDLHFREDGVGYFVLGQPRFQSFFGCTKRDLAMCADLVRQQAPDLIHIHGTERFYGLLPARGLIRTPCTISIQGLLEPYLAGFFGALSTPELWRSERLAEVATRRGLLWQYRAFVAGSRQEREILAGAKAVMGRTDWDRAHVSRVNPEAKYFHVDEVLRREFKHATWDISSCEPHTIIFTNAGEPRRGTEILLRALPMILREFPDTKLRLGGGIGDRRGYHRFLRRMIAETGLSRSVEFLGYLDSTAMADQLSRSHVFAISSYIENSPNSLCEAMQAGLPCVATFAGGIPSLVEHGRTGLLFPAGDAALLADSILRIFRSDDLAAGLGRAARASATERHDPQRIVSQLLNAYQTVLADGRTTQQELVAVSV
jgi:glycosyltransferase involved in cell wall biosynthesis